MFFDRWLIDAAVALQHLTGEPAVANLGRDDSYHRCVFLTPPWPEIYVTDPERRHGLDDAIAEYDRLILAYPSIGYEILLLPKVSVEEHAYVVLRSLADCQQRGTQRS